MRKILAFPTWLIFLLLFIPSFFPFSILGLGLTIIWVLLLSYGAYFLGYSLNEKLPTGHDLKFNRFKFHLFFVVGYLLLIVLLFLKGSQEINNNNIKDYGWIAAIIVPLHLFAMYCIFFVIWYFAKAIGTIEHNKLVTFDTYAGNFFLIWFFPIGIWFMHPKIRKILLDETESLTVS